MHDEASGIAVDIGHAGQKFGDIVSGRAMTQGSGSFSAEGVDNAQLLLENVSIKEEQSIEGLVLSAGRDAGQGEVCEKCLKLLLRLLEAGVVLIAQKSGIAAEPVDVGFFGVKREVFECASFSE